MKFNISKNVQRIALGLALFAGISATAFSDSLCGQASGRYSIVVDTDDLGPFVIVQATVGQYPGGCLGNNIDAAFAGSNAPFIFAACGTSHIYAPLRTWADVSSDQSLSCTNTLFYHAF